MALRFNSSSFGAKCLYINGGSLTLQDLTDQFARGGPRSATARPPHRPRITFQRPICPFQPANSLFCGQMVTFALWRGSLT